MSGHNAPRRRLLDLIAEPGVADILLGLRNHDGAATIAQLKAVGVTAHARHLRRLTVTGNIRQIGAGSLDQEPGPDTIIALTRAGQDIAETLRRIGDWSQRHTGNLASHPWWWRCRTALVRLTR